MANKMSDPIAPILQGFIAAHGWVDYEIDEVAISNSDAEVLATKIRQQIGKELLDVRNIEVNFEGYDTVTTNKIREVCQLEKQEWMI
mgnify:CR=1 FL=1